MSRRQPISRSAARYLLQQIEKDTAEALAKVRAAYPKRPDYELFNDASARALATLQGRLSFYANPEK